MNIGLMSAYYVLECGLYSFYEHIEGRIVKAFATKQLAIAYDSHTLEYGRLGKADDVMKWAADRRAVLKAEGRAQDASRLAVVLVPSGHDTVELNRLVANPAYITTFLQKAGIV